MAKKAPQTRVHQLAKELGVASKDIIAKCEAEGIPEITNHMSAVSMGLAATVREWFGAMEAAGSTAVEVAAPVDVEKARARAKKKAKKKPAAKKKTAAKVAPRPEETPEAATPAPPEIETGPAAPAVEPAPAVAPPETTPAPGPEATPSQPPDVELVPAAEAPAAAPAGKKTPVKNVPTRPESIKPAGPRLEQPKKTTLAGPKVIRVENPEVIQPPRPRSMGTGGPARGGRGVGMPPGAVTSEVPPMPGRGGRGAGASRRNKRRTATARDDAGRLGRAQTEGESRPFNWREQDLLEREHRLSRSGGFFKAHRRDTLRRAGGGGQRSLSAAQTGAAVRVEEPITIKSLSAAAGVKVNELVRALVKAGHAIMGTDVVIEAEVATELMLEFGIELETVEQKTAEQQIAEQFRVREVVDERPRPPVVTILGHVDHGKTSLLDRIRHAHVAEGEAGGITQATSAFRVPVHVGTEERTITFIDTPGHEAFTEMRSRGARVTDIVVLVVAADDGVMPQTIESIEHARAAEVPVVVALNKIDKPEATDENIQRILGQLAEHELNPSEWGGTTEVLRTSAVKNEGITELLEVLDYQAQLLELKADFGGPAEGTVIEARLEEGRGAVANVLVQQGELKKGDFIVLGRAFGRVRDIIDDRGQRLDRAGCSTPVAISGMDEIPDAGDKFYVVASLKAAESAAAERRAQQRERDLATEKVTLDNIFSKLSESGRKELPLIIKADVQGSVETLKATLQKISNDDIVIAIKHAAVGGVNDSDILLAETTGAIVIGFNVTSTSKARKDAEAKGVDIRLYDVIYDVSDDVTKAAEGLLEPEYKLEVLGHAEVREVFKISKVGMVAGCYVTDGVIERTAQVRVTRDEIVIEKDRRLDQLRRFKDDVKEVRAGQECGMRIDGYDDIKAGDVLECYKTLEVRRTL